MEEKTTPLLEAYVLGDVFDVMHICVQIFIWKNNNRENTEKKRCEMDECTRLLLSSLILLQKKVIYIYI
jgi:hypothetical protein